MDILLATLGPRKTPKSAGVSELLLEYRARISHFCPCRAENYPTEEKFLAAMERGSGHGRRGPSEARTHSWLVMFDSRGRALSTEQFAHWIRRQREEAAQRLVFAVGPPDGWSEDARGRAGLLLSLGPMTLPHELAAVVVAEQVYRAFTILEGHPYHLGHG